MCSSQDANIRIPCPTRLLTRYSNTLMDQQFRIEGTERRKDFESTEGSAVKYDNKAGNEDNL